MIPTCKQTGRKKQALEVEALKLVLVLFINGKFCICAERAVNYRRC